MVSAANGGGPGNPSYGGSYGNYSSDLDKLRAKSNAAAQQKALQQISQAVGTGDGGFVPSAIPVDDTNYLELAKQMFAPQTQYLDQQSAAAQKRAAENEKAVGGLYGQTVKDILGMAGGIKGNFDQGIGAAKNAYGQAYNQVGQAFDKSINDQMAILQRLGITQAAPNTVQQGSDARALLQGIIAANSQGSQNALNQMKQGALTFNTEQGNITRQAGAEAQTGVRRGLEDILAKIAGTKADLMGQINQSAMSMQGSAQDRALQQQQNDYNRFKDDRNFNYQMAKDKADYDLQLQKMAMSGQDASATDPLGKVYALANQAYGNSQSASNAVRLVSEAFQQSKPTNAAQFIQAVMDRAHRANPVVNDEANLQRLAALMFNEMYGKQSPNPLSY